MKNLRNSIYLTGLIIIWFLILSPQQSAGQVKKMSAKDLTEESTAVLYGKCSKIKSEWNKEKTIIYTYVTIVPEDYIKGNLGSEAVIVIPGGKVDDIVYEVSEMPAFVEGEDVMAFIWTDHSGRNLITGGSQGKLKIEKDSKTGTKMVEGDDVEEEVETEGQLLDDSSKPAKPEKVKLEDFVDKLKSYVKN